MKKILVSLIISLLLGLGMFTWSTATNVSACIFAPGCKDIDQQPKGDVTIVKQGFPATYKTDVNFAPNNSNQNSPNYSGFAEASAVIQKLNPFLAIVNVVFWYPVVYVIAKFTAPLVRKRRTSEPLFDKPESK